MRNLPLSDLNVLELSECVSGPYCGRLLAQAGANVIKIEKPDSGDIARSLGPFPDDQPHHATSGLFLYLNTNKKSITLDWGTRSGNRILHQLLQEADILVENMPPGTFDHQGLCAANPSLIVTSISYFGQDGPYRDCNGSDIVAQAMGGIMKLTGLPDREPLKIAGRQAEYQAGINAAVATLAATISRDMTGTGEHIDISVFECIASILEGALLSYAYDGTQRDRPGPRHPTVYPSTILPCKDGYLHIDAGADWDTFVRFTEIPELAEIQAGEARERADEIDALLSPWLANRRKEDLFHDAQVWRLPFAEVKGIDEVLFDEQLLERNSFAELSHPVAGALTYPASPFKTNDYQTEIKRAPLLGEHNMEIYGQRLGFTRQEIVRLRGMGVI